MKAAITLSLDIDEHYLEAIALRRGRTVAEIAGELVSNIECEAFDSVRWKDGVARVGVVASISSSEPSVPQ